jgi:thiamine biosynthesis lipoprotein
LRKTNRKNVRQVIIFAVFLFAAIAIFVFLYFKNKPVEYYSRTEYLLGTYVTIRVASKDNSPTYLADAAFRDIKRIDEKYSHAEGSIVNLINEAGEEGVEIDEETTFILSKAKEVARITDGAFDPTIYPVTVLWGFDDMNSEKSVPQDSEIEEVLSTVGYENIVFDEDNQNFVRLLNGAEIDLAGIAKGYAVDSALKIIKSLDENATGYIDAGGDIGIIGPKYGKSPWIIGIRNPRGSSEQDVIEYIYLYDGSVATSGDYENYFVENGIRYHHLLDSETGFPSRSGAMSSTVISSSTMLADAFATAAFVLGKKPGITFLPRNGALAFLILEDFSSYKSPGFEAYQSR